MPSRRRNAPSVPACLHRSASASNRRFSLPENWRRLAIATTSGSRRAASGETVSPVALRAPSATASPEDPVNSFKEDFSDEVMFMSYLYSKLPETGVPHRIGTGGAEIARRQAVAANDPLLKQSYRRVARERIGQDSSRLSEYDLHTRAKVAIDELRELVGKTSKEGNDILLLAATKEAETAVQRGRADYPESAEILATESDLRDLLNQAPLALASLERAFRLNPRQDWLAVRLAKRYAQNDDRPKAVKTIEQCLQVNPDSKSAHLQLAHLLQQMNGSSDKVLSHFRSSFTSGDNNFEGQFWYGRELFLSGRAADSEKIFESLSERAPGRFRTDASALVIGANGSPKSFDGIVGRKEEGYAFIKIVELAIDIFASRGDSSRFDWDRIQNNSRVSCYL